MSRILLQQAFDALTNHRQSTTFQFQETNAAIKALEQELAKPEQSYDHASDAQSILHDVNAELIRDAKPEELKLSRVSIGVDVTPKGTHVVACYNRPDAVQEMFYSQFHPLAKPEQEPVAWIYDWYGYKSQSETKELVKDWIAAVYSEVSDPTIGAHNIRPLYTAPPRKPWVGLTDKKMELLVSQAREVPIEIPCDSFTTRLLKLAEQTLKDKNT